MKDRVTCLSTTNNIYTPRQAMCFTFVKMILVISCCFLYLTPLTAQYICSRDSNYIITPNGNHPDYYLLRSLAVEQLIFTSSIGFHSNLVADDSLMRAGK